MELSQLKVIMDIVGLGLHGLPCIIYRARLFAQSRIRLRCGGKNGRFARCQLEGFAKVYQGLVVVSDLRVRKSAYEELLCAHVSRNPPLRRWSYRGGDFGRRRGCRSRSTCRE